MPVGAEDRLLEAEGVVTLFKGEEALLLEGMVLIAGGGAGALGGPGMASEGEAVVEAELLVGVTIFVGTGGEGAA